MPITDIYNAMWDQFCTAMNQNQCELDPYLSGLDDTRRGITALAYLQANNEKVSQRINDFLEQAKHIEPLQYYQPIHELHLTLLSIISCIDGFILSDINPQEYINVFHQVMSKINPIKIQLKGITASPSCIMVQGFPCEAGLNELRNQLRKEFNRSGLRTTMDARYPLTTAHVSMLRFRNPLQRNDELLALCEQYREYDFGSMLLTEFELVFNNWYQHDSVTLSRQHVEFNQANESL